MSAKANIKCSCGQENELVQIAGVWRYRIERHGQEEPWRGKCFNCGAVLTEGPAPVIEKDLAEAEAVKSMSRGEIRAYIDEQVEEKVTARLAKMTPEELETIRPDLFEDEEPDMGRMNKPQLLEYARGKGLEPDDNLTKKEIIAALEAAEEEKKEEEEEAGG